MVYYLSFFDIMARKFRMLAEVIKQYRLIYNLTQQQIADRMGVDLQTYVRWETGKTKMTDEKIQLYAKALGINPNDIYTAPSKIVNLLQSVSNNTAERDVCGFKQFVTVHNYYYNDNQLGFENQQLREQLENSQKLIDTQFEQIETLKEFIATLKNNS